MRYSDNKTDQELDTRGKANFQQRGHQGKSIVTAEGQRGNQGVKMTSGDSREETREENIFFYKKYLVGIFSIFFL